MFRKLVVLASVMLLACASINQAKASIITITVETIGSGGLGMSAFVDSKITITGSADTGDVTGGGGFFSLPISSLAVTVDGVGSGTFTESVYAFVNQGSIAAGFASNTQAGSILDAFAAAFATYDLTTAIGPITGAPFIRPDLIFSTTAGGFNIQSSGDVTFTAALDGTGGGGGNDVPEPGTLALLCGFGVTGGLFTVRRLRIK